MAKFVRSKGTPNNPSITAFKQSEEPTVAQGLTRGDIWCDINGSAVFKYCTSISPVTFHRLVPDIEFFSVSVLGTITIGTWAANSISTNYTDAKVTAVTGTSNRISVTGILPAPIIDISSNYVGQNTLTTLGTVTTGIWNSTKISEVYGGTNQNTYTLGDILYSSAINTLSKLPGNITTIKKALVQTGNGSISAAPLWSAITATDVGLSNVENTALSTWTGNTSISSVDTITTGTWNATPIAIAKGGTGVTVSNPILQQVRQILTTGASGNTQIPIDNTIPQNTEGDQRMTLTITPKSATSRLDIQVVFYIGSSLASRTITAALFQDATVNALAAIGTDVNTNNASNIMTLMHNMVSGTISATTFNVRVGLSGTGNCFFNRGSSVQFYGGRDTAYFTITEYTS